MSPPLLVTEIASLNARQGFASEQLNAVLAARPLDATNGRWGSTAPAVPAASENTTKRAAKPIALLRSMNSPCVVISGLAVSSPQSTAGRCPARTASPRRDRGYSAGRSAGWEGRRRARGGNPRDFWHG